MQNLVPLSLVALVWRECKKNALALFGIVLLALIGFIGLYAPFFASSKPVVVLYNDKIYFPLFRYLFYPGFFTKPLDIFFNLLMFTLPLFLGAFFYFKKKRVWVTALFLLVQGLLTCFFCLGVVKNPEQGLKKSREENYSIYSWDKELQSKSPYEKLTLLLRYKMRKMQRMHLLPYEEIYKKEHKEAMPLLFTLNQRHEEEENNRLHDLLSSLELSYQEALLALPVQQKAHLPLANQLLALRLNAEIVPSALIEEERLANSAVKKSEEVIQNYERAQKRVIYLAEKRRWLEKESDLLKIPLLPLRPFHWEEDAGGSQICNECLPIWERTRLNRKDLAAGLIFGVRISLCVGLATVGLSLLLGVPLGLISGFFGGKTDLFILRGIEIWEAMPTFFTLLLISAVLETKSLFLTIFILGLFSWAQLARFTRAEVLRERQLPYVLASKSCGFPLRRTLFFHILPNAIAPVLALLPFAMMSAITAEAGLSFLGLGEEGSTSFGVLMSEARSVFPGESYLLWPPALLLTLLLISMAFVGDAIRDALDPKSAQ